jgi:hypothetical protein
MPRLEYLKNNSLDLVSIIHNELGKIATSDKLEQKTSMLLKNMIKGL